MERADSLSPCRSLLFCALLSLTRLLSAGDGAFLLELEAQDKGYRNAIDLHGWLTVPEPIAAVHLGLKFSRSLVAQISVIVPDAFKASGLSAQALFTDEGATVEVVYPSDESHRPPAGQRVNAFTVRFCAAIPTPFPPWDFPLAVTSLEFSVPGAPSPRAGKSVVPPITILWGNNNGSPCFDEPPTPEFLACETQPDGRVMLTWKNPVAYDEIEIYTTYEHYIPGDSTSWIQEDGGAKNNFVYTIIGIVFGQGNSPPRYSEGITCAAQDPRPQVKFVRGDANADGFLSTADMLAIQHWEYTGKDAPSCLDTADVNDDGKVDWDQLAIAYYLFGMQSRVNNEPFGSGTQPPPPFPEPGYDPTHVGEAHYLSCDEYTVVPPETTNDSIRLGDVESTPGSEVLIPVFLTNERPIEAVQLVVRYDPNVLKILSGQKTISYDGTFYEQFVGGTFTYTDEHQVSTFTYGGPSVSQVDVHADDGIFTACIVGHLFFNGLFEIPPGQETIVAKIRATISGDVPPGTVLHIDPVNGPNDDGYGRFHLHNELTYKGEGRYATILPRQVGGILRIGVDGDISFFIRGDANDDKRVDVSDAISILDFLFLSKAELPCQDAADADDSGEIEITDAVVILSHLFLSTKAISPPYPEAGPDPNPDFLKRCRS